MRGEVDAIVLSKREFSEFVSGYMAYWSTGSPDESETDEDDQIHCLKIAIMHGSYIVCGDDADDSEKQNPLFFVGKNTNEFVCAWLEKEDGERVNLIAEDVCGGGTPSEQLFILRQEKNETKEELKDKIRPYMPSDFDIDAHYGTFLAFKRIV